MRWQMGWMGMVAVLSLAGCASLGGHKPECDCSGQSAGEAQGERHTLNEGYSMLYSGASGLANIDLGFLVKVESDDVQRVVQDVADYNGELAAKLESVTKNFPAVDIKLKPLPEIERRKRSAARKDRLLGLAPIVGRTGANFERTLLLTLSGGLNQQRFLARVMAKTEPNTALKAILDNAEKHYTTLYNRVVKLLNAQYFKHDTYEPVHTG